MELKCLWKKDAVQDTVDEELSHLQLSEKARARLDDSPPVAPDPLMILLHGYGSNEFDLPGVAEALELQLNWVSLRAPLELDECAGGFAWFNSPIKNNLEELLRAAAENSNLIKEWIDQQKSCGLIQQDQKFIFLGFSQGAVQVTHLLTRSGLQPHIHAVVALSGYLPFASDFEARGTNQIKVFHGYGLADTIVTPNYSEKVTAWLEQNTSSENHAYSGLMHAISMQELDDIKKFITSTRIRKV
ncbi:MAG: hypothetical protein LBP35_02935 [Candidatus Ancillula trichonymphae]|jgi:phospholipase/carboxylesterase|nr:hypothetical protein [Candidatus Ancillula trichonymphae]